MELDVRLSIKPPSFCGTDIENFAAWLYSVELYFFTNKLPASRYFTNGLLLLEGNTHIYMYDLILQNNRNSLTWSEFKEAIREQYDKHELRDAMLKEHLQRMRYHGALRMDEFCTAFQIGR